MGSLASRYDLRRYFNKFASIYEKILREGVRPDATAIVSRERGALVFFEFKKQKRRKFKYKVIDERIASAVQGLPQRGFRGDLSGVIFRGKNVIAERNRLMIIKGDNSKDAWSTKEAMKDALEAVRGVAPW